MASPRDVFLLELEALIEDVSQALVDRSNGIMGDGAIEELNRILNELCAIRQEILEGRLPDRTHRTMISGRIVVDSWSYSSNLGRRILRIQDLYERRI